MKKENLTWLNIKRIKRTTDGTKERLVSGISFYNIVKNKPKQTNQ